MPGICYIYFNYSIKRVIFCCSSTRFKLVVTELTLCPCSTPHLRMEEVAIKFHTTWILTQDGGEWSPDVTPRERAPATHCLGVLPVETWWQRDRCLTLAYCLLG